MTVPAPISITHQHVLSVINTLLLDIPATSEPVLILDAGCGDGRLMHYLYRALQSLNPNRTFVIHGFDVSDHGVQSRGFLSQTVKMLAELNPEVDWESRIFVIEQGQRWDFGDQQYDFVISNQVLEHVRDKDRFFAEVYRALKPGGRSVHLAPLRSVIPEGHIDIPFAHRINSFSALHGYIRLMSTLGIGKFKYARKDRAVDLQVYAERHADYIYHWTAYSSEAETLRCARANFMRADFRFTSGFFSAKLRQVLRMKPRFRYAVRHYGFFDALSVKILRYLSSVTLITEKKNTY